MINNIAEAVRSFVAITVATVTGALAWLGGRRARGEVWKQMYQVGNRSLLFVCVTLGFIGMVLVFQTCLQVNRITGDLSQVGAEFIKILVHEFGPSLTAMMLATRVGAGIAAEVGSMVVTEQIDALRMNGVQPIDYLIVPRFIASVVMTGVLAAVGVAVALGMGALTAYYSFHLNPVVFLDPSHVRVADLVTGTVKCAFYGGAIPIVSGWCGFAARGGSEGVGTATTRAVIASSFVVILLDFIISGVALLTWQGGP
ncbi:MAG TPA: ABC transporter permease [Polyangia bacterium]|nr:ABC transporter permease [Polyangia bacterium]